eukprot:1156953-Pelagomonas_calceolata.AAC.7
MEGRSKGLTSASCLTWRGIDGWMEGRGRDCLTWKGERIESHPNASGAYDHSVMPLMGGKAVHLRVCVHQYWCSACQRACASRSLWSLLAKVCPTSNLSSLSHELGASHEPSHGPSHDLTASYLAAVLCGCLQADCLPDPNDVFLFLRGPA